jgi:hypothetical protein
VVLVDGGTDSLARGDEVALGTPQEDIASIAAVGNLGVPVRLLACIGFGVDSYHGICHAHFLEAVAALDKAGGFLGAFSLAGRSTEASRYRKAVEYVFEKMPSRPSIVNASILSALDGDYGDVHRTHRTQGSKLWINPLMSMYWAFEVQSVVERCLYIDRIKHTETYHQLSGEISRFRAEIPHRPWQDIPV